MNQQLGTLYIISAPSGGGKTSLISALLEQDNNVLLSISHTTRKMRPKEKNGTDYYFIDEQNFKSMIQKDKFLEYASVFGNYYGTSHEEVNRHLSSGKDLILEIDWQGARFVREKLPHAVSVFILPPFYRSTRSKTQFAQTGFKTDH